jgi:hypothetical protein
VVFQRGVVSIGVWYFSRVCLVGCGILVGCGSSVWLLFEYHWGMVFFSGVWYFIGVCIFSVVCGISLGVVFFQWCVVFQ